MGPQERTARGSPRRVFVLDDDKDFRELMSRLIGGLGYQVVATDKVRTIDFAQLTLSDVLFVDLMMPEADGIQVLESLARSKVQCSIVPMSGTHQEVLATAETIAKRSGLRVIGVLNKPFRASEVRCLLEHTGNQPKSFAPRATTTEFSIEDVLVGLEHKEFDAFFQPIVELSSNQLLGYESLARWRSEKFSSVPPERFIAVAARNGVLPRFTRQMIGRSLAYAAKLKKRGLVWNVSVNIGAEDLLDPDFPEKIAEMLAAHDLPPGSLTLELTENSAALNETRMFGILARMRLKGIGLAIDDYGVAYSGLDRVSNIPFTSLKIDKQFISSMMTNRSARLVVESSIALAKRLEMRTVAEGIEVEGQRDILTKMGCEFGQGYLFAGPMELEQVIAWASGRRSREATTTVDALNHDHRESSRN